MGASFKYHELCSLAWSLVKIRNYLKFGLKQRVVNFQQLSFPPPWFQKVWLSTCWLRFTLSWEWHLIISPTSTCTGTDITDSSSVPDFLDFGPWRCCHEWQCLLLPASPSQVMKVCAGIWYLLPDLGLLLFTTLGRAKWDNPWINLIATFPTCLQ